MFKKIRKIPGFSLAIAALVALPAVAAEDFDEFEPIIEINATDGDIGFHVLLDGEAWKVAKIFDGDGDRMFKGKGTDDLDEQGITEIFMESAEPPCWFDEDDDDVDEDEMVDLEEFIDRFEEGTYKARGRTLEDERLRAEAEFTHNIPAAPETDHEVGVNNTVTIHFSSGSDLGQCLYPELLILDPAMVEVVRWEVVLEPNEDELEGGELPDGLAFAVFSIQLPADSDNWTTPMSVAVPQEYVDAYLDEGVNKFKYEVGAKEESGNQTFTEEEFEI